ncbi:MAG: hypothetical protein ACRCUB_11085 [Plesiomonas shigelloides]
MLQVVLCGVLLGEAETLDFMDEGGLMVYDFVPSAIGKAIGLREHVGVYISPFESKVIAYDQEGDEEWVVELKFGARL